MKKALIILLAVLMLVFPLSACKGNTGKESGTTTAELLTNNTEGDKPEEILEIPDNLSFLDSNGAPAEVNIMERLMTGPEACMEFAADDSDSDVISGTIFRRNETIKERLDVELNIKTEAFSSDASGLDRWNTFITNLYLGAGTDIWIVDDYAYTAPSNAIRGYYYDMNDMNPLKPNYLNFNKIWWNQNFMNESIINDKAYFAVGYSNITVYHRMEILFYNPILLKQYHEDLDLHKVVYDGDWTYEQFLSILRDVGAGDKNDPNSLWGWTARQDATTIDGWMGGIGIVLASKGPEGNLILDFESELNKNRLGDLKALYNENLSGLLSRTAKDVETPFTTGRAVFHSNLLIASTKEAFTNMPEFSIIPVPKYDEYQTEYRTVSHDEHSVMAILQNNINTDVSSAVLELVSYYGYYNMRPALFEKYFVRKMQTAETMSMLYYILDTSYIGFDNLYCKELKSIPVYLRETIQQNIDIASRIDARRDETKSAFDNLVKFFFDEE